MSGMLAAYAEQPDARNVDILFSGPADRADFLLDGRADVGLLYAPFDPLDGLAHETLYTEDRVAVMPAAHRLAGRESVRLAELEGEKRPVWKGFDGVADFGVADFSGGGGGRSGGGGDGRGGGGGGGGEDRGGGGSANIGAVADVVQMLHMIAVSDVIEVLPRSLIPPVPPGVALVTVADALPSRLVIAWNEHDRRPLVASFVAAAVSMRA